MHPHCIFLTIVYKNGIELSVTIITKERAMEDISVISDSALFDGVTPYELPRLIECLACRTVGFSKGDLISYSGQPQKYVGLLLSGRLSLAKENPQGQRMLLTVLEPGDSFGEVNAYSGSRTWPATITADGKGKFLAVPIDRIVSGCEKRCYGHWALLNNLLRLVSKKALILEKTIDYLGIKGIRRKICALLLEERKKAGKDEFFVSLNRNQLADRFYVTRPALSRELAALKGLGAIDFRGSAFKVLDVKLLEHILEKDV